MKNSKLTTILLILSLAGCNTKQGTNAKLDSANVDTIKNHIDSTSIQKKIKQPVNLEELTKNAFFKNRKFNSGTWATLEFQGDIVSMTLEGDDQNGNRVPQTITGTYKLSSENSISINWNNFNTIEYFNTHVYIACSSSGMTKVNQSHTFPDKFNLDWGSQSILFNSYFKQDYYAGIRCGNEKKEEYSEWTFNAI
jgi:hypothetical protein